MLEMVPLSFDNVSEEEVMELTPREKADNFLVTFQDTFQPLSRYKRYFLTSNKGVGHVFREIKNFYTRYVLRRKWSEKKYARALVMLFDTNLPLTVQNFERVEKQINRVAPKRRGRL